LDTTSLPDASLSMDRRRLWRRILQVRVTIGHSRGGVVASQVASGFHPGDERATIDASEQRAVMIRVVLEALAATRCGGERAGTWR
jgi:hypothetical protein